VVIAAPGAPEAAGAEADGAEAPPPPPPRSAVVVAVILVVALVLFRRVNRCAAEDPMETGTEDPATFVAEWSTVGLQHQFEDRGRFLCWNNNGRTARVFVMVVVFFRRL